jgi:uncharacterized membrane protein
MKTKLDKTILDSMSKDSGNWRRIFYFNGKDPRIIVPKLYPMLGWTLNFGNIYSYLAFIALCLVIMSTRYFL